MFLSKIPVPVSEFFEPTPLISFFKLPTSRKNYPVQLHLGIKVCTYLTPVVLSSTLDTLITCFSLLYIMVLFLPK